jgi:hypothetical protein
MPKWPTQLEHTRTNLQRLKRVKTHTEPRRARNQQRNLRASRVQVKAAERGIVKHTPSSRQSQATAERKGSRVSRMTLRHRAQTRQTGRTPAVAGPRPLKGLKTAESMTSRFRKAGGVASRLGRKVGGKFSILTLPSAARGAMQEGKAAHYKAMYGESRERTRKKRLRFGGGA